MKKVFLEVVKLLANSGASFEKLCLYDDNFAKMIYVNDGKTYVVSFRCEDKKEEITDGN